MNNNANRKARKESENGMIALDNSARETAQTTIIWARNFGLE